MITNLVAFLCDAGVPAIVSTIITVCHLLVQLCKWFADSFYAIPDKAKRSKITTASDRDLVSKATKQRNQSDTEGQSTDNGRQTITADHGLRVRVQQEGTETKYSTQQPTHPGSIQEPTVLLPGKQVHGVLCTTEHYFQLEGVPTLTEHQR